jgi:hypothetical protein
MKPAIERLSIIADVVLVPLKSSSTLTMDAAK